MAKKKDIPVVEEKAPEPKAVPPAPSSEKKEGQPIIKILAIAILLIAVLILAYYFLTLSDRFVTGTQVDAETFKGIFEKSSSVFIVMDVRGASEDAVSNNILQCGVDFAASSGMGGKTVTPVSFGKEGCIAPDGKHETRDCFSMLKDGVTIYVKEGPGGAQYYSNGMVVTVGKNYTAGTCGIKRT